MKANDHCGTNPPVAALVYRYGKGCRQYGFQSSADLAAWAARHPYKNEHLLVFVPVNDRQFFGPAVEAAEFVRSAQGA